MARSLRLAFLGLMALAALAACAGAQGEGRRDVSLDIPSIGPTAAPVADAGPAVVLRRRAARVGDRYRVTVRATSREQASWGFEERTTYDTAYDVEVLATEGSLASRLRVHYDHNVRSSRGVDTHTPVGGNTYLVDATQKLRVLDGGDIGASLAEAQLLADMFPDLGAPGSVESALRDGPVHLGERQDGLARAVARLVHPRAVTLESGSAVLSSIEKDRILFTLDVVLAWTSGSRAPLKGTVALRPDGRLARVVLDGAFEDGDGGARGQLTYERELVYAE